MNRLIPAAALALTLASCNSKTAMQYPETAKGDVTDNYFGVSVPDPYRWLEDDNSDSTAQWVKAENAVTRNYLDPLPYRAEIEARLKGFFNYERRSVPQIVGGKVFYSKNDGLQNQFVHYMADDVDQDGTVVLDPNKLSENGTVALSVFSVRSDARYLGYGIARSGSDWNEFYVRDLETLTDLPDHLEWIKFSSLSWYGDGFFYSRFPKPNDGDALKGENINNAVYYHKLGTEQQADKLIYSDPTRPQVTFSTEVTEDEHYLIITGFETTSGNLIYIKDLTKANSPVVKFIDNFESDNSYIGQVGNKLYFVTSNEAPNGRIASIDASTVKAGSKWNTVIAETADAIMGADCGRGHIFVNYLHDVTSKVNVFSTDGEPQSEVKLPVLGTVSNFITDRGSDDIYFSIAGFLSPNTIYKYSITKGTTELYRAPKIDFDATPFVTEQVFYPSVDGTQIPMFITHRKDIKLDGSNPAWIYAYGGFNISETPFFSSICAAWLEQGGVYAVPNLRGGGEYGEKWHLGGTLYNKKNVFEDFESAVRYLTDKGYTAHDKIVCQGGSNGGLLIGAVVNRHPELFRVALPAVGVMDMLRYQKFTIGRGWATDYGTSEDSVEMFEYLRSYSPLHTVKDQNYPSVLVTTGDHDDRVVPAHSFKYAATMQATYTGENPILIRIESNAGHGAGKPISKYIAEQVDQISFAMHEIGMRWKQCQ